MLKETNGEIDMKESETQPPKTTTNTKTSTNTTSAEEIDESVHFNLKKGKVNCPV